MAATLDSWPPQKTHFQPHFVTIAAQALDFLGSINSFVFLDAYPFHALIDNTKDQIKLEYALFESCVSVGGKTFSGLFEAQYFGFQQAMEKLNDAGTLSHIPDVYIGETGWASTGSQKKAQERLVATIPNAQTYWENYIAFAEKHHIPSFMFEMFDEPAKKPTKYCDRHYGIYDPTTEKFKFTIKLP